MEIRQLQWDDANRDELARHRIADSEAQELLDVDEWVADTHPAYPGQVRIIGRTRSGRWLTVALEPTARPEVWRPITGWDSTPTERAYYWNQ
jgi:hypothetical protein